MRYFAYGSNISARRLQGRISIAEIIGMFRLDEHDLRFHKVSMKDGSGKCDAYFTGNNEDFVLGVLYEVADGEKAALDVYEGLRKGYDEKKVSVHSEGQTHQAITYVATAIDKSKTPYSWYVRHVLEGAKAAGFPDYYIAKLENVISQKDRDTEREEGELSIYR